MGCNRSCVLLNRLTNQKLERIMVLLPGNQRSKKGPFNRIHAALNSSRIWAECMWGGMDSFLRWLPMSGMCTVHTICPWPSELSAAQMERDKRALKMTFTEAPVGSQWNWPRNYLSGSGCHCLFMSISSVGLGKRTPNARQKKLRCHVSSGIVRSWEKYRGWVKGSSLAESFFILSREKADEIATELAAWFSYSNG